MVLHEVMEIDGHQDRAWLLLAPFLQGELPLIAQGLGQGHMKGAFGLSSRRLEPIERPSLFVGLDDQERGLGSKVRSQELSEATRR